MSSRQDSGTTAHLTSILCWTFLPSLFTNLLLTCFYRLSPSSRPALPANASSSQVASANTTAQLHFRRARITLVLAYLLYSILNVYWSQSSQINQNYYSLLGISRQVVETDGSAAIKSQWRRLARIYHPDKVGKTGEQRFVELRKGVDILENDNKRWAYERFGPSVGEWGKLVTHREFLAKGAMNAGVFWLFALVSIAAIGLFRKDERRNNFWRYLSLALAASLEFHFLLQSSPSPTFSFLFPHRLAYEHIALLRQLFISVSMAMSQLTPLLFPIQFASPTSLHATSSQEQALALALQDAERLKPLLSRLAQLTTAAQIEAIGLQRLEMRPLLLQLGSSDDALSAMDATSDDEVRSATDRRRRKVVEGVKAQMKRTFEDLQLKSDPQTAGIWEAAVKNGRNSVEAIPRRNEAVEQGIAKSREEGIDAPEAEGQTVHASSETPSTPLESLAGRILGAEQIKPEAHNANELPPDGASESNSRFATHLPSPPPEFEGESSSDPSC